MGVSGIHTGKLMKIPVVATIHQLPWFVSEYLPPIKPLTSLIENCLWQYSRWLNDQCESMIVPTQTISQIVEELGGFQPIPISNGINLSRFTPPQDIEAKTDCLLMKLGLDPVKPTILHVGRLDLDKRVDVVIRAAAKTIKKIDAQLLVVGDGECRESLMTLANHLGIGNRSFFPGFMNPQEEIPEIYRMANVFTTASEIETQGLVLLEAIASGLPVVAVNATCIPEIVKHDINGFLTQPGDENAISERLFEILNDPQRASRMGRLGRILVQNHSIERTIDLHENLYKSVATTYQQDHFRKPVLLRGQYGRKIFRFYRTIFRQLERNEWIP
jgi:glycosyltransferase involved in cell wall biosynthesis